MSKKKKNIITAMLLVLFMIFLFALTFTILEFIIEKFNDH